jgi:hypothetical protein
LAEKIHYRIKKIRDEIDKGINIGKRKMPSTAAGSAAQLEIGEYAAQLETGE